MKHAKYLAIAIAFLSLAASCKNEEPEPTNKGNLVLKFDLYNGASPMDWDDVISISDVNEYRMEFFKFYLSNLYAVKTDGSKIKLSDVIIVDASKSEGVTFSYNIPNGSYDKVEWGALMPKETRMEPWVRPLICFWPTTQVLTNFTELLSWLSPSQLLKLPTQTLR
jgi:hypothetical protein